MRVAFLGLGIMGRAMASNLARKGFEVRAWNRHRERVEGMGLALADTPAEAAREAELVVAMLAHDEASRAAWTGPEGALAGVRPGTLLLECSTLSPAWIRELAGLAEAKGCRLLDAPVTGSKVPAEAGQLTFLAGGAREDLQRAEPALMAMGTRIVHAGPQGSGSTLKLLVNLMFGTQVAALAEFLALAGASGLDPAAAAEGLLSTPVASPAVRGLADRMINGAFDPQFPLRWAHKDLGYALDLAAAAGLRAPAVEGARAAFAEALAAGLGERDVSAVAEVAKAVRA